MCETAAVTGEGDVMGSRFEIARAAWIDARPALVYRHVADLRRWADWMPWEQLDPSIVRSYDGPSHGVGARSSWSGGRPSSIGHVEIVEAVDPRFVACSMVVEQPVRSRTTTTFHLRPERGGTLVTWRMATRPTGATRLVLGVTRSLERIVGPQFEDGLRRLRAEVEATVAAPTDGTAAGEAA